MIIQNKKSNYIILAETLIENKILLILVSMHIDSNVIGSWIF
jgi:hypothetical protein